LFFNNSGEVGNFVLLWLTGDEIFIKLSLIVWFILDKKDKTT